MLEHLRISDYFSTGQVRTKHLNCRKSKNVMSADNQHATLKLAWLAGIIDGEGSLMIPRYHRNGNIRYGYRVSISNTNMLIINQCREILDILKIKYCNYTQDRGNDGLRRKITHQVHITNRKGILVFLEKIIPHLVGKRKQAELLNKFLNNWESIDKNDAYLIFRKLNERVPR